MRTKDSYITLVDGKTKSLDDANARPGTIPGRLQGVHVQADGSDVRYCTDDSALNGSGTATSARGLLLANGDDRFFDANMIQIELLRFLIKQGGAGMIRLTYFYEDHA